MLQLTTFASSFLSFELAVSAVVQESGRGTDSVQEGYDIAAAETLTRQSVKI